MPRPRTFQRLRPFGLIADGPFVRRESDGSLLAILDAHHAERLATLLERRLPLDLAVILVRAAQVRSRVDARGVGVRVAT